MDVSNRSIAELLEIRAALEAQLRESLADESFAAQAADLIRARQEQIASDAEMVAQEAEFLAQEVEAAALLDDLHELAQRRG